MSLQLSTVEEILKALLDGSSSRRTLQEEATNLSKEELRLIVKRLVQDYGAGVSDMNPEVTVNGVSVKIYYQFIRGAFEKVSARPEKGADGSN